MWIQHPVGFYSAVQIKGHPDMLDVRSRHYGDAVALQDWLNENTDDDHAVVAYTRSDYPYRVHTTKASYAQFLTHLVMDDLEYGNFKDEVTRRQGWERHDIYANAWGVFYDLTYLPGGHAPADVQEAITVTRKG